jgi:hypothetical protein
VSEVLDWDEEDPIAYYHMNPDPDGDWEEWWKGFKEVKASRTVRVARNVHGKAITGSGNSRRLERISTEKDYSNAATESEDEDENLEEN